MKDFINVAKYDMVTTSYIRLLDLNYYIIQI